MLDLGTGTGCWAVEFAERFPDAEVIGNDLSPIQPAWVWPNLRFEVDDVELEWAYPDGHFDFIHVRCMSGCVDDWEKLLREAYRCLAPGGWVEFQDYSGGMNCEGATPESSALLMWFNTYQEGSRVAGRDACVASEMKGWFEEVGFEGVVEKSEKWPVGNPGPGAGRREREVGKWTAPALAESLEAFSLGLLTRVMGWERDDVEELVENARAELREARGGFHSRVWVPSSKTGNTLTELGILCTGGSRSSVWKLGDDDDVTMLMLRCCWFGVSERGIIPRGKHGAVCVIAELLFVPVPFVFYAYDIMTMSHPSITVSYPHPIIGYPGSPYQPFDPRITSSTTVATTPTCAPNATNAVTSPAFNSPHNQSRSILPFPSLAVLKSHSHSLFLASQTHQTVSLSPPLLLAQLP